jgi:hypothetical protein
LDSSTEGFNIADDSKKNINEMMVDFEELVEELVKDDPSEIRIKELMFKIGLEDNGDAVDRIAMVLEKMNALIFESKNKKGDYDLR